jgi:hypothetical protein
VADQPARAAGSAPSVAELTEVLTGLYAEATEALKHGGEYGRPYRQAMADVNRVQRLLEAAKEKQARRERDDERDPHDIAVSVVDRLMGH